MEFKKKLIYICAPLKGDIAGNIAKAHEYCRIVIGMGFIPICPHLMLAGLFNEDIPQERQTALEIGLQLVPLCGELWKFTENVTEGMQPEIERAEGCGIPVKTVCFHFERQAAPAQRMALIKGILHTSGKTEEEIRAACDVGEQTPEDVKNQIDFYNLLDGMEVMLLPHLSGEYAFICPAHEEDYPRVKEAYYLMEQDSFFGCYIGNRAQFDKDWDAREYSSDGSLCFNPAEVEIVRAAQGVRDDV